MRNAMNRIGSNFMVGCTDTKQMAGCKFHATEDRKKDIALAKTTHNRHIKHDTQIEKKT